MPEIKTNKRISATYRAVDIERLIRADLDHRGIVVPKNAEIYPQISGGVLDENWKNYSGGFGGVGCGDKIVPAKFEFFFVTFEEGGA